MRDANASLIAAAPELLEACKAARDVIFDGQCAQDEEDPIVWQILDTMDDVIERAEGKK
jgi:hypothetical protein